MAASKRDKRRAKAALRRFQKSLEHVNDVVEFNNKLHELNDIVTRYSNGLTAEQRNALQQISRMTDTRSERLPAQLSELSNTVESVASGITGTGLPAGGIAAIIAVGVVIAGGIALATAQTVTLEVFNVNCPDIDLSAIPSNPLVDVTDYAVSAGESSVITYPSYVQVNVSAHSIEVLGNVVDLREGTASRVGDQVSVDCP